MHGCVTQDGDLNRDGENRNWGSHSIGENNNDLPDDNCLDMLTQTCGNREAPRPSGETPSSPGFLVFDDRSRMRFLESARRRRVSRRENAVELGPQTKFVVFFSVAIGTPSRRKTPRRPSWSSPASWSSDHARDARVMKISLATAEHHWTYARTWLYAELKDRGDTADPQKRLLIVEGFRAVSSH